MRAKAYTIPESSLIGIFNLWNNIEKAKGGIVELRIPKLGILPEGAKITRVHYSDLHMSLVAIVEHPDFPDVKISDQLPVEGGHMEWYSFRIEDK